MANSTQKKSNNIFKNLNDSLKSSNNKEEKKFIRNSINNTKSKDNKSKKNNKKIKNADNNYTEEKKKREKIIFNLKLTKEDINKLLNDSKLKKIEAQKSTNNTVLLKKMNLNDKKTFNSLINKQNSLQKEIEKIKEQKEYYSEYSLNNLKQKNIPYRNIQSDNIKNLEQKQKNILHKLSIINQQINDFNPTTNKNNDINILNNSVSKKDYLGQIKQDRNFNNFSKRMKQLQVQSNLSVQKIIKETEISQIKKNKELDLIEKEKIEKKNNELKEKIIEEKKMVELRREETILRNEKYKPFLYKNFPKERNKNYLYVKMATSFENKEEQYINKMIKNKTIEEKEKSNVDFDRNDYLLKRKLEFIESNKKLHKQWKERSELLPKYVSPMYKKVLYSEESIRENEKNKLENKNRLFYIRQKYGKEKVRLPLISNILKRKTEQREKERKISASKSFKLFNNNSMNLKIIQINKKNNNNLNTSKEKKLTKSSSCMTIINNKSNNLSGNIRNNANKKTLAEIIHLDQLKKKKTIKSRNSDNKLFKNDISSNNKDLNLEMMKGKIEAMESQYKRGKELLKIRGGYIENKEFGDKINNILIKSIQNKLDIIENIMN